MTAASGDALSHVTSMNNRPPIRRGGLRRQDGFRNQSPIIKIVPLIAA
jgi:hypothetical protein